MNEPIDRHSPSDVIVAALNERDAIIERLQGENQSLRVALQQRIALSGVQPQLPEPVEVVPVEVVPVATEKSEPPVVVPKPKAGRGGEWTPERRAAQAERMKATRAAQKATPASSSPVVSAPQPKKPNIVDDARKFFETRINPRLKEASEA